MGVELLERGFRALLLGGEVRDAVLLRRGAAHDQLGGRDALDAIHGRRRARRPPLRDLRQYDRPDDDGRQGADADHQRLGVLAGEFARRHGRALPEPDELVGLFQRFLGQLLGHEASPDNRRVRPGQMGGMECIFLAVCEPRPSCSR
jgi:hypothetical protein